MFGRVLLLNTDAKITDLLLNPDAKITYHLFKIKPSTDVFSVVLLLFFFFFFFFFWSFCWKF